MTSPIQDITEVKTMKLVQIMIETLTEVQLAESGGHPECQNLTMDTLELEAHPERVPYQALDLQTTDPYHLEDNIPHQLHH